jgi:hypothetical protein
MAYKNKKYLQFVRNHPCCYCRNPEAVAHHVRERGNCGVGLKPDDYWSVPVCVDCHDKAHRNELPVDFKRIVIELLIEWIERCAQ